MRKVNHWWKGVRQSLSWKK